jgi:hypothetical protein
MTFRAPGRARRAGPLAAIFAALGLLALCTPTRPVRAAETSAPVKGKVASTNAQLLQAAVQAVANELIADAPLTPGMRIGLRAESDQPLDSDVAEALLQALNARRIECVLLAALPAPAEPGAGEAAAQAAAPPTGPGSSGSSSSGNGLGAFAALQAERAAQVAHADSLKAESAPAPEPGGAASSVLATGQGGDLTVISYRVAEARVDYVRQFRGGLFGAQRIERRGSARIALRMSSPGSDAVRWSASADTSVGDVVLKSEIAALEDRTRPETRPTPPSSGVSKIVEPVLVVLLIAGLVSLFYQNRP